MQRKSEKRKRIKDGSGEMLTELVSKLARESGKGYVISKKIAFLLKFWTRPARFLVEINAATGRIGLA